MGQRIMYDATRISYVSNGARHSMTPYIACVNRQLTVNVSDVMKLAVSIVEPRYEARQQRKYTQRTTCS
eukprot:26321-Eustigmatos_ZCMA.PRE.1